MRIVIAMVMVILAGAVSAQDTTVLTMVDYINIVKEGHPITYQAAMLADMADGVERMARGAFDPKLEADWDHKSFDDKNYYSIGSGAVKLPTWYGVELKAGYDRNNGDFLNDSDSLPLRGLWNAGISVPLGRGLVIDERRAELQKAEIYRSSTVQEQLLITNELLYDAANAYLDWQVATAYLQIALDGQQLARTRFVGTVGSFRNGDKPAIDTLESLISLQTRELEVQKAQQQLTAARLALDNFLWVAGEVPLELTAAAIPEPIDLRIYSLAVDSTVLVQENWIATHPELLLYDYKIDNINIDERLAKEDLKPDVRISYNPLLAVGQDALFDRLSADDYKVGVSVTYPIMQRKQRGKLQLTRLKRDNTVLERALKGQDLNVKLNTYVNNIRLTEDQYELLTETVVNYDRMLTAENRKFQIGESSIFLVNTREIKYLESRYKLVEAARKLTFNKLTYLLLAARLPTVL